MEEAEIIPISNLLALRSDTPSLDTLVAQLNAYAAARDGLAELASVIEEEAGATNSITNGKAVWDTQRDSYRVLCTLDTVTRKMVIVVNTQGISEVVLCDDDMNKFAFNCPATARWPLFLKEQHELAKAHRAVATAQAEREEQAKKAKRQSVI